MPSRSQAMIAGVVAVVLLAVLGSAATAPAASRSTRSTVTVRNSSYGRILFDGRGFVLYAFARDPRRRSVCSGACAARWPPYILKGSLHAGLGVKRSLLGSTRRANGARQVTYAGRPLYYYVGDRKPGQVLCQNVREFGGLWLVVRPSGALVR